jgi:hypothetical protein
MLAATLSGLVWVPVWVTALGLYPSSSCRNKLLELTTYIFRKTNYIID